MNQPALNTEEYLRARVREARAAYDVGYKEPTRVWMLSKEVDQAEKVLAEFLERREEEMARQPAAPTKPVKKVPAKPKYLGDATAPKSEPAKA